LLINYLYAFTHKITEKRKAKLTQKRKDMNIRTINIAYTCFIITFAVLIKYLRNMDFSKRLKKIRIEKGLTKGDLAKLIGVHYSQIGRYEEKGAQPSSDVMAKLANALEISTDFLMNGTSDDLANSTLTDKELLNQFKTIEKLSENDKGVVKVFLDAFITKGKLRKLAL